MSIATYSTTRSAGRGVGPGGSSPAKEKSEAGPLQVGLLLSQRDELLAELELLLDIDSDERRGEREVGVAVDECGSVEDDRRRRGRRALLALRARPVDRGHDRSYPGPAGVDGNRVQSAAVVPHVGERAADTHVLEVRVELRRRRPYEPPTEGAVRTLAHEADPEGRIGVTRRPRLDEVVRLHDQAAVGGRGAIRALERDQPAGGGNFLCEAVRGRCDGRYDKHREGDEQGDDVPVRPGRSVRGLASRQRQTTHQRPPYRVEPVDRTVGRS